MGQNLTYCLASISIAFESCEFKHVIYNQLTYGTDATSSPQSILTDNAHEGQII